MEELFQLPAGVRPEEFAPRLLCDVELHEAVRTRFEQGRASGKFPLLSRCESDFPPEAKDMFLVVGWVRLISSPERPWDRYPYEGDEESYREDLYNGVASDTTDLRRFAKEWLEELARAGYLGMEGSTGLPSKQRLDGSAVPRPASIPPYGEAYPVRLEKTQQVLWLQLDGERSSKHGYREIRVANEPVRTDKAILAALTAMEGRNMDLRRLKKAFAELKLPPGSTVYEQWREAFKDLPPEQKSQGKRPELHKNLQHHQALDYVLLLLRHHRPGFDDLPQGEKLALVESACYYVNKFLVTLRSLAAFLEFGVPDKPIRDAIRDPDGDVRAAVLSDVVGLNHTKIGKELGVPPPASYATKGETSTMREKARRGRDFLTGFLGEDGYQQLIRAKKAEAEHWRSLSDAEQHAEDLMEHLGIPYEEALQRAEEEEAYFEERRRSRGEPENG